MIVQQLPIPDVRVLTPRQFADSRGFFSETYNRRSMRYGGLNIDFVQDNHSMSVREGTLRGLHFQYPPFSQDKLLRVLRGSVFDVAVDLRWGSPNYGKYVSHVLSAEKWDQIFVPIGFAHGFLTLEPHTEVLYKVSNYYSPEHDSGLIWNDPDLGIEWPISSKDVLLSEKDAKQPVFRFFKSPFLFDD